MRYLYGDSGPFPLQYNFLATLEVFIASAARAAQLDAEARALRDTMAESAAVRGKSLAALEGFHQVVVRSVQDAASRTTDAEVLDYARQLVEQSVRIVEDTKRTSLAAGERELATTRSEVDRRKNEIRRALEQFLTAGRIQILESKVSMKLVDGKNVVSAVLTHPDGIVTSFTLAVATLPEWQAPRKVGDVMKDLVLTVGVRKSLFKRQTQQEPLNLDEYIIGGFELTDDTAQIRLRRKLADAQDSYVFNLTRVDTNLVAEVHHPNDAAESETPTMVDSSDHPNLEKFWQLLRARITPALAHKEHLVSAELDGQDLFEQTGAISFIERIIKLLAPTVLEISKRSPNPHELSLKMESDGGRREEIYVKKEDLLSKLDSLGERERMLFAPLSLGRDTWLSGGNLEAT